MPPVPEQISAICSIVFATFTDVRLPSPALPVRIHGRCADERISGGARAFRPRLIGPRATQRHPERRGVQAFSNDRLKSTYRIVYCSRSGLVTVFWPFPRHVDMGTCPTWRWRPSACQPHLIRAGAVQMLDIKELSGDFETTALPHDGGTA